MGGLVILAVAATGFLPLTARAGTTALAGTPVAWWVPIGLLITVSAVFAYLTGIVAVRRLGSSVASFVSLTEVIFAVVFAVVLLAQRPTAAQLIGGVLVLAGIALVQVSSSKANKPRVGSVGNCADPGYSTEDAVAVGDWLGEAESVGIGEPVGVSEALGVADSVGVPDSVEVSASVGAGEAVGVGEPVGVSDSVGVGEPVGVSDSVGVGVGLAWLFVDVGLALCLANVVLLG